MSETTTAPKAIATSMSSYVRVMNNNGSFRSLKDIEAEVIAKAMTRFQGDYGQAARALNMGRTTLYRKLIKYQDALPQVLGTNKNGEPS